MGVGVGEKEQQNTQSPKILLGRKGIYFHIEAYWKTIYLHDEVGLPRQMYIWKKAFQRRSPTIKFLLKPCFPLFKFSLAHVKSLAVWFFWTKCFCCQDWLESSGFLLNIFGNQDKEVQFCQARTSKLGLQMVMHVCSTYTSYFVTSFHFLLHLFKRFLNGLQQKECGVRVGDSWKRVLLKKLWMSKKMQLQCDRWQCLFMEDFLLKNKAGLKTWKRKFLAAVFF